MKRHMTQLELTRTRRLIEAGVTEIPEIQKHVFCHEDNIQSVLNTYDIEPPAPKPAPVKKAAPKKAAKPAGAAAVAAAKKAAAKKAVDPLS